LDAIRATLRAEGYFFVDDHLAGRTIQRQLKSVIKAAREGGEATGMSPPKLP